MTLFKVTANLTYLVDLPDEDDVYDHADQLDDLGDVQRPELEVTRVQEVTHAQEVMSR